ncbi:glycyl-radical enzyme activating protein [Sedimentibacter sp. zth1]|uniref:trans-4-hydroxy-L-proline dehydratase activase n=1 Tax=Sedimentibacter sp. zth1 TaxID=2816908 RepID=UPI001A92BE11|nr:trans-4-hydroxy-L-proline dehydratase activase [Sedimentibacter sp. zth1]QSX05332.1 glycyl-radical enzyme activating protein [Sedimentibacter sp. zth1]
MNKALIFNIQKFSLHDGQGIRTTIFFKGCPLNCKWCHNPEGINIAKEIMHDNAKCTLCRVCIDNCPSNAISIQNNNILTDNLLCKYCGKCVFNCVYNVREIVGKEYTVEEVLKEVLKDKVFYEESGGGVTLSGGEPVMQIDFVEELLKKLKENNIHTAVDTSGAMTFDCYERIYKYTDVFLYDLKIMDDEKHKIFVGTTNKVILENLKKLSKIHKHIIIRMPIINNINANFEHISTTIKYLKDLNIEEVNLLPYHDISRHKYRQLNINYDECNMSVPSDNTMDKFKEMFQKSGLNVKIGG